MRLATVRFKGITVKELIEIATGHALTEAQSCEILTEVGLCAKEYVNREVNSSLSGGEIKRIEIATVLAKGTVVGVRRTGSRDRSLEFYRRLIEVFTRHREERQGTMLVVSHQERLLEIADEIIVIANGKVTAQGSREEILPTFVWGSEALYSMPEKRRLTAMNETTKELLRS